MIFVIEVGAHHIYDDTGFCHNYRHRSVISMTEKIRSAQNVTDVSFFVVQVSLPLYWVPASRGSIHFFVRNKEALSVGPS